MKNAINIEENYKNIKNSIKEHEKLSPVEFIAVSKYQPIEKIEILLEKGHRSFAESRVEEAIEKWSYLKEKYSGIRLHFIGGIQSKKIKKIVSFFDVIQSVDRIAVAEKIASEMDIANRNIECLIQINIGREEQKSGIDLDELEALYIKFDSIIQKKISGFMCIPPSGELPEKYFKAMCALKNTYGVNNLSMGMSADYLTALENGSTMIRVGSMLFGERLQNSKP